eukprot:s1364_g15.t1
MKSGSETFEEPVLPSVLHLQLHSAENSPGGSQNLASVAGTKISQYIDYAAGFLVLINSFALMLQLEMEGWQVAGQIGMPGEARLRFQRRAMEYRDGFPIYFLCTNGDLLSHGGSPKSSKS